MTKTTGYQLTTVTVTATLLCRTVSRRVSANRETETTTVASRTKAKQRQKSQYERGWTGVGAP